LAAALVWAADFVAGLAEAPAEELVQVQADSMAALWVVAVHRAVDFQDYPAVQRE
jgi:hypothetical protein